MSKHISAGSNCPGLPFPASMRPHPVLCIGTTEETTLLNGSRSMSPKREAKARDEALLNGLIAVAFGGLLSVAGRLVNADRMEEAREVEQMAQRLRAMVPPPAT